MNTKDEHDHILRPFNDLAAKALKVRISRNTETALAFDDAMFRWHYRFAFLVLTLRYDKPWIQSVTIETLQEHRDTLLNRRPFNTLLEGILGCIWKLEQGDKNYGVHMHKVIYYDADRIRPGYGADEIAEAIGQYWVENITGGMGYAHNSNAHPENTHRFGVVTGVVHRSDAAKRFGQCDGKGQHAYLEHYMCKGSQQVQQRGPHDRMFSTTRHPRAGEFRLPRGAVSDHQFDYILMFIEAVRAWAPMHYAIVEIPGLRDAWIHVMPAWLRLSHAVPVNTVLAVLQAHPQMQMRGWGDGRTIGISVLMVGAHGVALLIDDLLKNLFNQGPQYFVLAYLSPPRV